MITLFIYIFTVHISSKENILYNCNDNCNDNDNDYDSDYDCDCDNYEL